SEEKIVLDASPREYKVEQGPALEARMPQPIDPRFIASKFQARMVLTRLSKQVPESNLPPASRDRGRFGNRGGPGGPSAFDAEGEAFEDFPDDLKRLTHPTQSSLFLPNISRILPRGRQVLANSEYFKLLIEHCPADARPPQPMLDYLTSADADRRIARNYSWSGMGRSSSGGPIEIDEDAVIWRFFAYAPTSEEAQR